MRVFISWSGERSKAVATALRFWLPSVIQPLTPWMSEEDIEIGQRWGVEIAQFLGDSRYGVVCMTPENVDKPWINFEAGALSTALDSRVSPYLLDLRKSDLQGPLSQFQTTIADEEGTLRLLRSLNAAQFGTERGVEISDGQLVETFRLWWPKLKDRLEEIAATEVEKPPKRSEEDILEEILELVRGRLYPGPVSSVIDAKPEEPLVRTEEEAIRSIQGLFIAFCRAKKLDASDYREPYAQPVGLNPDKWEVTYESKQAPDQELRFVAYADGRARIPRRGEMNE